MMRQFLLLCAFSLPSVVKNFSSSLKISPLRVASVEMTTFLLKPGNGSVLEETYILKNFTPNFAASMPFLCALCG